MSFSVSYTYKIIDKFTPQLREIERQTEAFNRKVQGLSATTNQAGKSLQDMGKQAQSAAKDVSKAGTNLGKGLDKMQPEGLSKRLGGLSSKMQGFATSAASLASTVGGGLLLRKFSKDAMDLENSVVDLTKVFDFADARALNTFQNSLGEIARKTGQTKSGMNAMAYEAGKLGIAMEEVGGFAEMAGMAAVAFKVTLPQATDYLSDLRVKLGLNNKSLRETLDTINYIDDKGEASSQGMLEIMARFSGQASALKIAPGIMAAFAATAEKLEVSPAKAASGLEMMVQRLQDVKKFDPSIAAGLTTDFSGTINKVINKLKTMDQVSRNLKVQELFGNEAAGFVLNFIDKQDLLNKNLALSADKLNAVGSMAKEFGKQSETASFKMLQMDASLTDVSASIGQTLLPYMISFANQVKEIVPKIQAWVSENPGITKFGLAVLAAMVVMAPLALGIAGIVSAIGFLISPIGLIVAGVGLLTAGLVGLYNENGKFTAFIDTIVYSLTQMYDIMMSILDNGFLSTMKDLAGTALDAIGFEEAALAISSSKTSTTVATLNGSIDVNAKGGAKVSNASMSSTAPGNLGMNAAGAR